MPVSSEKDLKPLERSAGSRGGSPGAPPAARCRSPCATVPVQPVPCCPRAPDAGAKTPSNLAPEMPRAAIARPQRLWHIYEATRSLPRWPPKSARPVVCHRAGAAALPAAPTPLPAACLTSSSRHLQAPEQTKHPFHASASFLGLSSFLEPRGHPGSHRPQPRGHPLPGVPRQGPGSDFIIASLLGAGRVSTLSVDVPRVASGHVGGTPSASSQSTTASLCLRRAPKSMHFAQDMHVQGTESGGQVKPCPEERAGALGTLPSVDTQGRRIAHLQAAKGFRPRIGVCR